MFSLLMVSSRENNLVLMEDCLNYHLSESMNILQTIVKKTFFNVSIILFLNNMALLLEKVKSTNIKKQFLYF